MGRINPIVYGVLTGGRSLPTAGCLGASHRMSFSRSCSVPLRERDGSVP